jgi:hypothetical protein
MIIVLLLQYDVNEVISPFKVVSKAFNPKRPGLFGQLNTRGGVAAAHFGERSLELPNFHFCPQTVFHMKAGIFS